MALMSGRRRILIARAALVLLVMAAAGVGIGEDDITRAGPAATPPVVATAGKTQTAMVASSKDVVRTFQVSHEPQRAEPGKVIHLTFDDGPTATYTEPILDLLDEYGAKATFFQVGENAATYPELSRAVLARGHGLGSHTWSHRDLRKLSPDRLNRQIARTSNALRGLTGRPVTCLRPPYGAVNARVRSEVRDEHLDLKLWDIDPRDWKRPGAAVIARRVVSKAAPGAVVLMHDGGGNRSQSVRALDRILRSLDDEGYSFTSLPGC